MNLFDIRLEDFIPLMAMTIPIIAVIGGITAGIMRSLGRQRLVELAQRERIAAIERGLDPAKLPPLPAMLDEDTRQSHIRGPKHRAQGLMIGGLVTLFGGAALGFFLSIVQDEPGVWAVGLMPAAIGVALLLSAIFIWPRGEN